LVDVLEVVDDSARNKEDFACAYIDLFAGDGEGEHSLKAATGFIIGVVAVGSGDTRSGGNVELEPGGGAGGLAALKQEADGELTDANYFGCGHSDPFRVREDLELREGKTSGAKAPMSGLALCTG
jgi:hypothetical protein